MTVVAPIETGPRGPAVELRTGYVWPLDGVRGVAIAFVLLYHHQTVILGQRFVGGLLPVSTLFVLSGFVIGRLLVSELDQTGHIDLRRFALRRVRRLLPASFVVLLVVAQWWWLAPATGGGLDRRGWFAALTGWENWHLLRIERGYNALFSAASPVQHFWSLSIEQQWYVGLPVIVAASSAVPLVRRHLASFLVGLAAVGCALGWWLSATDGVDRAYYATEVRGAELLLGAALAVWWVRSPHLPRVAAALRGRRARAVGWILLGADLSLWYCTGLSRSILLPDWPLFPVWATANAVLVCALIAVLACGVGPTRVLTNRTLVWLGQRSFGAYLAHWPVFLVLDRTRFPMNEWALLVFRVIVTFVIVEVLYRLVEHPVRTGRMWPGRTLVWSCAGLAGLGVATSSLVTVAGVNAIVDPTALDLQRRAIEEFTVPPDSPSWSSVEPDLPARVLFVGDSQAWALGHDLTEYWGAALGVRVEPSAGAGCGVGAPVPIRYLGEETDDGRPGCREWRDALPAIVSGFRPGVIVVVGGFADLADHRIPGVEGWTHIGRTEYDAWLREQMREFVDEISLTGVPVLWLSHPHNRVPHAPGEDAFPEEASTRMDRYNELIAELAMEDPRVEFADLAAFAAERSGGEFDPVFRPDGTHIDLAVSPDLAVWLGERIADVSDR